MSVTIHRVHIADAADLSVIPDRSVALVVTSPPYPMIAMWDELFGGRNPAVADALTAEDGVTAFELMHADLDRAWAEAYRVLIDGGFACINIGDATRTVGERFRLYPNHARILSCCLALGFDALPAIVWRKQTNAPNKFMGSGMLPAGAYVTLEHEYILILRKGARRVFADDADKLARRESALFWEERNVWFSDLWDFKGTRQDLSADRSRSRSAAFPFELAYRLVSMYSCRRDTVLDPFLGTGTTTLAAIACVRDSIGVEIDPGMIDAVDERLYGSSDALNEYIANRVVRHRDFCERRAGEKPAGPAYTNANHGFPVTTRHEIDLKLESVRSISRVGSTNSWRVEYAPLAAAQRQPSLF